ncbi:TIGR04282 family arsenosugar biosynthesis glycosyltransferase [Tunicatimonas pelagia]|uniref:TIGR04282 family arsenosugar biosynthesis glycosyltransferase n=1 Tax=Tunicatimonas pelagia TaxID=931531 RepID=UPI002665BE2C|nr:TIGR04282 family arsenosugar biosynthesis glycosyltransferase [Tunicatimonas pelagia]WKN44116.1 TIGR04282 family arsenosugar biosynthesis glycosyltransferase [Tunicatimonas pelagia]
MTKEKELLIIFAKVPELGKAKTRLAADVGDEPALEVYRELLAHTQRVTLPLSQDKIVYYTPHIVTDDQWENDHFQKALQAEGDLGERMRLATAQGFNQGYSRICIIGTDCLDLTTKHLTEAFATLHEHDVVLGPSQDGGYYLLGMNQLYSSLFFDKAWSTESVADDTRQDVQEQKLSLKELPTLNDIDTIDDLKQSPLRSKYLR